MSDYISKSALIEEFQKRIGGDLDVDDVEYLEKVVNIIPTVDEKEIIRKTVERVVERLEGKKWGTSEWRDKWRDEIIGECIEVVKEVGEINE